MTVFVGLASLLISTTSFAVDTTPKILETRSKVTADVGNFFIPGVMTFDESGWHYADRVGRFYNDYPWIYVEGSEWWYVGRDGWWFPYSLHYSSIDPHEVTQEQIDEINTMLEASMESYEIPGIAYAIKFAGQPAVTQALGVRSLEDGDPLDAEDRFRVGSTSKSFMGMAILHLINEGELGLDMPISTYLPTEVLSGYDKDAITIRMLLQHTSGINTYTNIVDDWNMPYVFDRERVWTNEELVELVNANVDSSKKELGKLFSPGESWSYSNTNTVLLGIIIKQISGKTPEVYLNEDIIPLIGLKNTWMAGPGEPEIAEPYMEGYMDWQNFNSESFLPAGMTNVTVYDTSGVGPAGAVISNVEELAIWAEALAHNRYIISADWQQLHVNTNGFISFTPKLISVSYGLHLVKELDLKHNSAVPNIAHRGQISGYDTVMIYFTEVNCAITMVCNRTLPIVDGEVLSGLNIGVYNMIEILFPEMVEKYKYEGTAQAGDESPIEVKSLNLEGDPEEKPWHAPLSEY